jgi:hypothetical protein
MVRVFILFNAGHDFCLPGESPSTLLLPPACLPAKVSDLFLTGQITDRSPGGESNEILPRDCRLQPGVYA